MKKQTFKNLRFTENSIEKYANKYFKKPIMQLSI